MTDHTETVVSDPGDAGAPQPRKRKRVPVACGPCRGKKSKCDGKRPSCSGCEAQGLACVYANAVLPSIAMVSASYLEQLEKRLETVEREMRLMKSGGGGAAAAATFSPAAASLGGHSSHGRTPRVSALSVPGDDAGEDSPDATDGVGTIEFDDRSDSMYFGPSSNIAFTRLIQRTLARAIRGLHAPGRDATALQQRALGLSRPPSPGRGRQAGPTAAEATQMADRSRPQGGQGQGQGHAQGHSHSQGQNHQGRAGSVAPPLLDPWFSSVGSAAHEADDAFVVPAKDERVRLASRFFRDTGVLFPYVSEAAFWQAHAAAEARGFRCVRRSWLGLLNMVLAMAISTDPDPGMDLATRSALSSVYFGRAKALCMDQMMAGASVEIVQVILLMTQYLQGTRRSMQTWTIHGIAVKAALQLGLHVRDPGRPMDAVEAETRLRTWQGCVGLDRTLSMTFGRPPSIMPAYVRAQPARHVLGDGEGGALVWSASEASTQFWNATLTLYQILYDVIDALYGSNAGVGMPAVAQLATAVMQVEQQLIIWQAALPPGLALLGPGDLAQEASITLAKKLQLTLTLRYHNIRILAHRPVLDCSLEHRQDGVGAAGGPAPLPPHEAALLRQIGQQSQAVCLQSAEAIISLVHSVATAADVRRGFFGAWWFTLYYTLNASLTIVALLLYAADAPGAPPAAWELHLRLLNDATTCIPRIDPGNSLADKCAELVATLRNYVHGLLSAPGGPAGAAGAPVLDAWDVEAAGVPVGYGTNGGGPAAATPGAHAGVPGLGLLGLGDDLSTDLARFLPDLEMDGHMYNLFDTPGVGGPVPRDLLW